MYYGAGGQEPVVEMYDSGIVATSLALDSVVNGNHSSGRNSIPGYKELMAHAEAKDAPSTDAYFSKNSLNSSVSGNRQVSEFQQIQEIPLKFLFLKMSSFIL